MIKLSQSEIARLMAYAVGQPLSLSFGPGWCGLEPGEDTTWALELILKWRQEAIQGNKERKEGHFSQ